MLIDGIHVPLTAPFDREGRSYLRKLEQNVGRYSLAPVTGLVVLGPGGEAEALSDSEAADVLRVVGESAAAEKVLVAGVAKDSVRGALALADVAAKAGFDAVLVSAPKDWAWLGKAELRVFFEAVADGSPLPVMLWSEAASYALPVEFAAGLAQHSNVVGMYDADLDVARFVALRAAAAGVKREVTVTPVFAAVTGRMLKASGVDGTFVSAGSLGGGTAVLAAPAKPAMKTRKKTVGFQLMSAGRCAELLPLLEAGVGGAMPLMAACAPQACFEVYAAFKDGDSGLSSLKAERVRVAEERVLRMGPTGVKYACDWNGYYGGAPRLPRLPLTGAQRGELEKVLREVRN